MLKFSTELIQLSVLASCAWDRHVSMRGCGCAVVPGPVKVAESSFCRPYASSYSFLDPCVGTCVYHESLRQLGLSFFCFSSRAGAHCDCCECYGGSHTGGGEGGQP